MSEMGKDYIHIPYYKLHCHKESRQKHSGDILKSFQVISSAHDLLLSQESDPTRMIQLCTKLYNLSE